MQRNAADLAGAMRRHAKLVYSLAYSRTQNSADAEDIFQEVFLRMAQRRTPFQSTEHEKAWLIRVTANLSTNLIASAWRRHVTLHACLPERRIVQTEENDLDSAMKRLPERDRALLYLRYSEGYTPAEIAGFLGDSEQAIRKRITRARKRLGILLSEQEKEADENVCDRI